MAMTKTRENINIDKVQALTLFHGFMDCLEDVFNKSTAPKISDFEKFLNSDFQMVDNGKLMCRTLADYATLLKKLQAKYSRVKFVDIMQDPLFAGHRLAFSFTGRLLERNGEETVVDFMVIATIENNNKISKWVQVSHERGFGDWNS